MIKLHPEFISKNGQKEFAAIPYEEFLKLQEILEDIEDLRDLIAEMILSSIDRETSEELKDINFLAVRFKDDYRFLCESESKAKQILKVLSKNLSFYNLSINENKTSIQKLPDGLYRKHDRQYFPHSLKNKKEITFKCFEHTLLIALDIHRNNPGTSILEKFISECFIKDNSTQEKKLKITFSENNQKKITNSTIYE